VPNQFQMVKENISDILSGFEREPCPADCCERGYDIYSVRAWDYPALIDVYEAAAKTAREYHIPALVHVTEVTQPQGHSTSGSHERYKTPDRLQWEAEFDCLVKMRAWMIENDIINNEELTIFEEDDRKTVEKARAAAWEAFTQPILTEREEAKNLLDNLSKASSNSEDISKISSKLRASPNPLRRDIFSAIHNAIRITRGENSTARHKLLSWKDAQNKINQERYSSHLYSQTDKSALKVAEIKPAYNENAASTPAFEILNACFDAVLARDPRVIAFGEDVGQLGDVNQGFHGLQEKYGSLRVMDTGIREATILGQAIGLAMRGLRPICEIQYLDYLLYALQLMSDDLATLRWRTKGGQKAPVIVRTRGHRLEGIWHSGSPMAGLINLVRGMYVLVPRNAVQAAGFYNNLLKSDDPGIIVEVLNGYRIRERMPDNIAEIVTPLGMPDILRSGSDVTLVTYGAMCRIAIEAAEKLNDAGIDLEIIDVQSLLPFDRHGSILESLKRTNRIIFADEDVPGGTTAYMMQEVIEKQGGYYWLDSAPRTLTAQAHRPAYGSDGDYWSKPSVEDVFDAVYEMMSEVDPDSYPEFYK